MQKELCPKCKSERTIYEDSGVYGGYWVCYYQGCDAKLGADKFFWKPGAGLAPKPPKKPKSTENDAAAK